MADLNGNSTGVAVEIPMTEEAEDSSSEAEVSSSEDEVTERKRDEKQSQDPESFIESDMNEDTNCYSRMNKNQIIGANQNKEYFCYACRYTCGGARGGYPNCNRQRRILTRSCGRPRQCRRIRRGCLECCPQTENFQNQLQEQYYCPQQDCCQQCYQQSGCQEQCEQCCPQNSCSQQCHPEQCYPGCSSSQQYCQEQCCPCSQQCCPCSQQCCPQPVCYCYQSGGQARLISHQVYCCPGGSCCSPTCTVQPSCCNPCCPPCCSPQCCCSGEVTSTMQPSCCNPFCPPCCSPQCCCSGEVTSTMQPSCCNPCCNPCCPPCFPPQCCCAGQDTSTIQPSCCNPCPNPPPPPSYNARRIAPAMQQISSGTNPCPPPRPPTFCNDQRSTNAMQQSSCGNNSYQSCPPPCCCEQRHGASSRTPPMMCTPQIRPPPVCYQMDRDGCCCRRSIRCSRSPQSQEFCCDDNVTRSNNDCSENYCSRSPTTSRYLSRQNEDLCNSQNNDAASDLTDPNFVSDFDNCDAQDQAETGNICQDRQAPQNYRRDDCGANANYSNQNFCENLEADTPVCSEAQNYSFGRNKEEIIQAHQDKEYVCFTCQQSGGGGGGVYPNYDRQRRVSNRTGGGARRQSNGYPQDNCPENCPQAENCPQTEYYPAQCCPQQNTGQCYPQQNAGQCYPQQNAGQCCPQCTLQCCPCPQPTSQCCPSQGQTRLLSQQVHCSPGGSCCPPNCATQSNCNNNCCNNCGQGQGTCIVTPQVNCCPPTCCKINTCGCGCPPPQSSCCCDNGNSNNCCNSCCPPNPCCSDLVVAIDDGPGQNPCQSSCRSCNCPTVQLCCGPVTSCQPAPCAPCPCCCPPCSCCKPCCCQPCCQPCCQECPPCSCCCQPCCQGCPCRPPGWYVSGYQPFAFYNCLVGYNCTFEMKKRTKIIRNGGAGGTTAGASKVASRAGGVGGDPDTEGDYDGAGEKANHGGEDSAGNGASQNVSNCVVTCGRKVASQCNAFCPTNCLPRRCVSYTARFPCY